jgi:uncharacterized phage infection (PIP) family protein YhgE
MTKKLEDLFNLEEQEQAQQPVEAKEVTDEEKHQQIRSLNDSMQAVNKITGDLPQIRELDHLADKAEKAYDDLMDLGMNVEVRYSGRIFEVASSMLKNAVDAKTAKVDKKLKAVDLQLKKLKIDKDSPEDPNDVLDGKGYVMLDRNELMKKLSEKE